MAKLTRVVDTLITVKTKLAGAVSRLLESKLSEVVSVGDFGNLETDAGGAFARAVASGAKTILVPDGDYTIHSMTIPDGVTLYSQNREGATIRFNGDVYFPLRLGSRSCVRDLVLDFSACTVSDKAIYIKDAQGSELLCNRIIGAPTGHTVYIEGTNFAGAFNFPHKVLGNCFTGGQGACVYLFDVQEFAVCGNKAHGTGDGILAHGSKRIRCASSINDNVIMDSSGQGIATMLISNARDQQAYEGLTVTGNRVRRARANGIIIQSDLTVCSNNVVMDCGQSTDHQGILVNANGVTANSNVVRNNAGVGIDLGNCRKTTAVGNVVEENGWLGIEVNRCEDTVVADNVLDKNLKGKTAQQGNLQAAILVHEGSGGYVFTGENKNIVIDGNLINSGEGQTYAIYSDANSKQVIITNNGCRNAGQVDDIVTCNADVTVKDNSTRWSPSGTARATLVGNTVAIPSEGEVIFVNGTGEVTTISCIEGVHPAARSVRLVAVGALAIKTGVGNIFIAGDTNLTANQSIKLWWNQTAGGWVAD